MPGAEGTRRPVAGTALDPEAARGDSRRMRRSPLLFFLACSIALAAGTARAGAGKPGGPVPDRFDASVVRRIAPVEVRQRVAAGERPIFIDTRGRVSGSMIRGALHLPADRLEAWAKDAPRNRLIVAYCT